MSMLSGTGIDLGRGAGDAGGGAEDDAGSYLTDGVNLYRVLGAIPSGMGEMVGLENCRTLDVALVPVGELRARRMRVVVPSGVE